MVRHDRCQCAPKQGMRRRIVSPILGGQEALLGLGFLRVEQRGFARRIRVRQCRGNGAAQMQEREVRHIPRGSNSARNSASISIAEPTHLSSPCRGRCGPLLGRKYDPVSMSTAARPKDGIGLTEGLLLQSSETKALPARAYIQSDGSARRPQPNSRNRAQSGDHVGQRALAVLDEGSVLELPQRLLQFGLAIHHNRTVPGDRLLQRLA
jgi:hypothetical protein